MDYISIPHSRIQLQYSWANMIEENFANQWYQSAGFCFLVKMKLSMDHKEDHKVSHAAHQQLIYCSGFNWAILFNNLAGPETKLSQTVLSSGAFSADGSANAGINTEYETESF